MNIYGSAVTLFLLRNSPDVPDHSGSLQTATVFSYKCSLFPSLLFNCVINPPSGFTSAR